MPQLSNRITRHCRTQFQYRFHRIPKLSSSIAQIAPGKLSITRATLPRRRFRGNSLDSSKGAPAAAFPRLHPPLRSHLAREVHAGEVSREVPGCSQVKSRVTIPREMSFLVGASRRDRDRYRDDVQIWKRGRAPSPGILTLVYLRPSHVRACVPVSKVDRPMDSNCACNVCLCSRRDLPSRTDRAGWIAFSGGFIENSTTCLYSFFLFSLIAASANARKVAVRFVLCRSPRANTK